MRKLFCLVAGMLLLLSSTLFAQQREVTGKVTDVYGAPIFGASVRIKNTRTGTSTSADGTFKLSAPANSSLLISIVGYEDMSVDIGTKTTVDVSLKTDTKGLSEVVVTGTGSATSKRKLGFAVESITADKLPATPNATLDQALVGKIPGAQISSISGNPGDQVNIILRGINTVQGGTRPMILMDGVEIPFANLNTLDMSLVERVEIVQGAASATLYGAQGANGVIQIFTKKGQKGKLNINVSSSYSVNKFINAGDFGKANLHPYLTDATGNIVYAGSNAGLGYTAGSPIKVDPVLGIVLGSNSLSYRFGTDVPGLPFTTPGGTGKATRYGLLDPRNQHNQPYVGSLKYNDHFAEVFQSAPSRNNSININGGNEKVDYSFGVSNNRTNSALLENNGFLDRTNITLNLGMELFKGFTIRSVSSLAYSHNTMNPNLGAPGGTGFGTGTSNAPVGGVYGFLNTSPFFSLKDTIAGGNYASYQRASFASVNAFNPFFRLQYTDGNSKRYDIIQSFEAAYKVNKFVSLNARYGITYRNENDVWTIYNQTENANTIDQDSYTSWFGSDASGEIVNWQYNNTVQNFFTSGVIKTDFEKDFNINFPVQTTTLVGFDYRKKDYKELNTWGQTLALAPPFNMNSTQAQYVSRDYVEPFVTYGYLVDQKFDFGNWGGISGGFRTDFSSAFGAGSKPFTFPHYNGYLLVNSFNFWNGVKNVIPSFKLRGGFGKAGIQPFAFDRYVVLNSQPTGTQAGYSNPTSARNPDLNVEVSSETEIGTDITFNLFKDKNWLRSANVAFTWWQRKTDGAIYTELVPASTGASSIVTNAINLHSDGWQLAINLPLLSTKNLTWDFTANFGHQISKYDEVQGGIIQITSSAGSTGLAIVQDRIIGEIYGYKALTSVGQLRADKTPFIAAADQSKYEIVNGRVVNKTTKAIFFSDEAESFGNPNPKLVSSFINNLSWKGTLTFGFQFDWVQGAKLYNQTNEWMYRDGISRDFQKPVTINGETGAWSAYYASAYYALGNTARGVGNNVTKDFFYEDASFVRLRNVSLGVDLSRFTKKDWLKKCQIVLSGRNLATFTKYSGMDPEISSGASNSSFDRSIDHSTIPNMRAYQVTLNVGF